MGIMFSSRSMSHPCLSPLDCNDNMVGNDPGVGTMFHGTLVLRAGSTLPTSESPNLG